MHESTKTLPPYARTSIAVLMAALLTLAPLFHAPSEAHSGGCQVTSTHGHAPLAVWPSSAGLCDRTHGTHIMIYPSRHKSYRPYSHVGDVQWEYRYFIGDWSRWHKCWASFGLYFVCSR